MSAQSTEDSAEVEAIRILCASRLQRRLWIPESELHPRLRVTFSTTNNFDDETLPAVLFMGPLFGTRYMSLEFDGIASKHGVRVICVDRPGFGGSTPIPAEQRISVWLETVPLLLKHLRVKHVSFLSHSAGTLYMLNTLYSCSEWLHPQAPYAALLGPWVHFENSHATLWKMVSKLPVGMLNSWGGIVEFINTKVMPMTSWSSGIMGSFSGVFQTEPSIPDADDTEYQDRFGVSREVGTAIERLRAEYIFAEGITGINEEVRLCLKRLKVNSWGAAEDYERYMQLLVLDRDQADRARLNVDLYFAESDVMIGEDGREYMEGLWKSANVAQVVTLECHKLKGTDHETVIRDMKKGAVPLVFEKLGKTRERTEHGD